MAISDITKPMALDETLQSTNTALGLLAKDVTVSAISTALGLLGKDTSIQAITTALGLLNKDATMVTQNSKLDTIIAKLQGIIEALGVDTSIYKAAGNKACADLTSSLLVAGNLGNVYNITDNGTTTADFVEGAGKPIHLGDNVAVVDIGTGGSHVYKFDLLSGLVDLSNYIQKSETAGLVKNDGTIDTKDYAEKVASATNGNLAGLNASGNLTDSGWNGAKDTTSISGNPISISGLKANQLAVNPTITLEPIQAGSGTPSPSNIRAISGYDKIEVLSCGVNLIFDYEKGGIDSNTGADNTNVNACRTGYIRVSPNTSYYFIRDNSFGGRMYPSEYDSGKKYLRDLSNFEAKTRTITTSADCHYIRIAFFINNSGWGTNLPNRKDGLNYPATETSYVASNKTTDLSETLGQTVYGGSLDVRTGVLTVTRQIITLDGTETWDNPWNDALCVFRLTSKTVPYKSDQSEIVSISNKYETHTYGGNPSFYNLRGTTSEPYRMYAITNTNGSIMVKDTNYTNDISAFKASLTANPLVICYELATPFTIQLTPHEISLLSNYAYVSTNGTSIALDYHNGELASLADVSQLGETVNELGKYVTSTSLLNGLIHSKEIAVTTNANGLALLNISTRNACVVNMFIKSSSAVHYIALVDVYQTNNYGIKALNGVDLTPVANQSITVVVYYYDL